MTEVEEIPSHPPDWVGESARAAVGEVRHWFTTCREFIFHPLRFTTDWIEGRSLAMNPLGFLAASAAILGIIRGYALLLLDLEQPESLAQHVWQSITPFLHYIGLGLLAHIVLFSLSCAKRSASSTAAMTMYAAGSAGAIGEGIAWLIIALLASFGVKPSFPLIGGFLGTALGAFCYYLGFALGALHQSKWWHVPLAFALVFVVSGLFFGHFNPPGEYGVHWFLRFWDSNGTFKPFLRLGF